MMLNKNDQERVTQLLTDAITVLCKNGLSYESHVSVEGLLGITLDDREVFLVKIDENVTGHRPASGVQATEYKPSAPQRMAVTSPRQRGARPRGRTLPSRGRFVGFGNRKRNLFGGVPRSTGTLNSQGGLSPEAGEPPTKMRVQGDMTHSTTPAQGDSLIEIGDDDSNPTSGSVTASNIKAEPPDYPHTMPADSTQGPDSKYTLDNETSKSLTSFLDNLMTAHSARNEAGGNGEGSTSQSASSSSPSAAGSSALSHLAQMASPKSEPPAWDQQQYDSSSIPGSSPQPQQANGIRVKSEASDASECESAPNGPSTSNGSVSSQSDSTIDDHITSNESIKNGHADSTHSTLFNNKLPIFSKMALPLDLYPAPVVLDLTGSNASATSVFPSGDHDLASFYNPKLHIDKKEGSGNIDDFPSATTGLPFLDPYTCRYCFKKCSGLSGLNKHVLHAHINPEEKPFQCLSCQKGFQSKALLNRHKKEVHLGIYPHHCKLCGKGFQKTSRLTTHMMLEHQFTCVACGLCCTSKEELHKHLTEEHRQQPGWCMDQVPNLGPWIYSWVL